MTDRKKSYTHAFPALDEWFSGRYKVRLADKTPRPIEELHTDYLQYATEHGKRPEKKQALVQYLRKYRQVPVQRHRGVNQYAVGIIRKAEIASTVKAAATPTAKTAERIPSEHRTIQAIETRYKGYRFRSRLEARWAVFFDHLGIEWEYEPQGYVLSDGTPYLPDFWLPKFDGGMYVEVKPNGGDFSKAMQFAQESRVNLWLAEGRPGETYAKKYTEYEGDLDTSSPQWFIDLCLPCYGEGLCDHRMYWDHVAIEFEDYVEHKSSYEQDYWGMFGEEDLLYRAIMAARSARFEHGEKGAA